MSLLTGFLASVGAGTLALLALVGRVTMFAGATLRAAVLPPWHAGEFFRALVQIGWLSLPVVGLTALFTGGALALQIYTGGGRFNAESVVPSIVAIGIVRELGPVLGGLMVAARVASSIAAELGTMKVTEQIDALTTLSTDPTRYLVVPRVLAAMVAVPALVFVGDIIGIFGGFAVGVGRLDFQATTYLRTTVDYLEAWDVISGLLKGVAFGFIVALMGCYCGLNSGRGAQGVGAATKSAVVSASVLILASNYLLTELFFTS